MLSKEKKTINFLIENELEGFPYGETFRALFSAEEIEIIEQAADRIKNKFKIINENLTKDQKFLKRVTYEHMKIYFNAIMLEFYGEKLVERAEKNFSNLTGFEKKKMDEFIAIKKAELKDAKRDFVKYRVIIRGTISEIVEKKKMK